MSFLTEFNSQPNWEDKYKYLIYRGKELAKKNASLQNELQQENYLIKGCQSNLWMKMELVDGKFKIQATSDAAIVRGIVTLLIEIYNNNTPDEILKNDMSFLKQTGLIQHLSPNRSTGLYHMLKHIRRQAELNK